MIVKKFIQLLITMIVFNASSVAMSDDNEEAARITIDTPFVVKSDDNEEEVNCITKRWRTMFSIDDSSIEEKTTKQGYYGFGGAFCMFGAHIYQNNPLAGVLTMVFGGFLYYKGWNTPA